MKKVSLLSAFQSHHWLAMHMAQKGYQVSLIDFSSQLGRWTPSDWEGPFGFFKSADLSDSQIYFLLGAESVETANSGFSIWLKHGPLDFRSPMSLFHLQQNYDYTFLEANLRIRPQDLQAATPKPDQDYQRVWPYYLAKHFPSSRYTENRDAEEVAALLPLMDDYCFRHPSRYSIKESLSLCEKMGVQVIDDAIIRDVNIQNKNVMELEIDSRNRSTVLQSDSWICGLTTADLQYLSPQNFERLHSQTAIESMFSWVRYSFEIEDCPELESFPNQFMTIEDIRSPWFHDNCVQFLKTTKSREYDVWLKVPSSQRFQRQYLEEMIQKVYANIKKRLPVFKLAKIVMPQEFNYGYVELGPSRHPVFSLTDLVKKNKTQFKNWHWLSAEEDSSLDWRGRLLFHQSFFQNFHSEVQNDR